MAGKIRWRQGQRISRDDSVYDKPMGVGHNVFAVLPELQKGKVSLAIVDESGVISGWIMRHEPKKDVMAFLKNRGKSWSYYNKK